MMCITHAGVFNVSNKVFVTLDILFDMRNHVTKGEPPGNYAEALIKSTLALTASGGKITFEEAKYLTRKVYDGYFAFEAMTSRNWNNAICGICGIAPVFESGDGNVKNCTPLKKGQVYIDKLLSNKTFKIFFTLAYF